MGAPPPRKVGSPVEPRTLRRPMEPKFTGPSFAIGIEEELMILDSETLALANAIEAVLEEYGEDDTVKPELLEPVLEIATAPHPNTAEAGEQLRRLRREVAEAAGRRNLCIGSAGTPPLAELGGPP